MKKMVYPVRKRKNKNNALSYNLDNLLPTVGSTIVSCHLVFFACNTVLNSPYFYIQI